jgi:hypothetical protein
MPQDDLDTLLNEFNKQFDTSYEDRANQTRGAFLRAFPLSRLSALTLDGYVIGKGLPSFCAHVEAKTKPWANILGATSTKFGIYFGRTKSDPSRRYRFVKKFGTNPQQAFSAVRDAVLRLVRAGTSLGFDEVDANPLSQMFKAKILSLYFSDKFMNVCSRDHIEELAAELGIPDNLLISEKQHLLLEAKFQNPITKDWSNPKAMTFLYNTYIRKTSERMHLKTTRQKTHSKIDIEEMLENRKKIGERSEKYALKWEKERLLGLGHRRPQIEDWRDRPSCGYDFLSDAAPEGKRHIEVKSAGKNWADGRFRFFLSETQHTISKLPDFSDHYYFYLVFYDDNGNPHGLEALKASELYDIGDLGSNGYVVTFDRKEIE